MNRTRTLASIALVTALLATAQCRYPATALVLGLETDMSQGVGNTLTDVRVVVRTQEGRVRLDRAFRLAGTATEPRLPADLSITPRDNDATREVTVEITPQQSGRDLFTYRAVAPFEARRTNLLRVFLADRCRDPRNQVCPEGLQCGQFGCEPVHRSALPPFDPEAGFADASLDAIAHDAPADTADADAGDTSAPDAAPDAALDSSLDAAPDAAPDAALDVRSDGAGDVPSDEASDASCTVCTSSSDVPACVDTRTSLLHCGRCNNPCASPLSCVAGACACPSVGGIAMVPCGARCTSLEQDPDNCGMCGRACSAAQTCRAGVCAPLVVIDGGPLDAPASDVVASDTVDATQPDSSASPAGQTACADADGGTSCVDVTRDVRHCGRCGNACTTLSTACEMGVCTACPTNTLACAGAAPFTRVCADTRVSQLHCGACGVACPAGDACSMGHCSSCASGTTSCLGAPCADLQTDNNNCGACSVRCSSGTTCIAGTCTSMSSGTGASCASPVVLAGDPFTAPVTVSGSTGASLSTEGCTSRYARTYRLTLARAAVVALDLSVTSPASDYGLEIGGFAQCTSLAMCMQPTTCGSPAFRIVHLQPGDTAIVVSSRNPSQTFQLRARAIAINTPRSVLVTPTDFTHTEPTLFAGTASGTCSASSQGITLYWLSCPGANGNVRAYLGGCSSEPRYRYAFTQYGSSTVCGDATCTSSPVIDTALASDPVPFGTLEVRSIASGTALGMSTTASIRVQRDR